MLVTMPRLSNIPNRSGASNAVRTPRQRNKRKHRNHCQSADQSELFADDRKDEIRMRKRQKQHLLFALRKAEPVWATRTDRDQRLDHLKSRALLIGPRIEKRDQAFQSPRHEDQQARSATISAGAAAIAR